MAGKLPGQGAAEELRRSAEAELARDASTAPGAPLADQLHELRVHQIELELQNDELRRTREALELAHARYVELYDFAPVGYFTVDARGSLTALNLAGAALLGADRAELLSRPFSRFVAAPDLPRWEEQLRQTPRAAGPGSFELQLVPPGGRPFTAQLICREDQAGPDGRRGLKGALLDVTERRRAEEERERRVEELQRLNEKLKKTQAQLLQAERLAVVGQLAAGVAHEINNPLTFVKANLSVAEERAKEVLEMLQANWRAQEVCEPTCRAFQEFRRLRSAFDVQVAKRDLEESIGESLQGVDRVVSLVRDLRDFALPDRGRVEEADLQAIVERALRVFEGATAGKARLVTAWGAEVPRIKCRPSQLDQVFMNLLLNAVQAGRPDVTVTVRTGRTGEEVWAEVEDDGPGIPDERLDRVFEPFFTTKPIGKGTGLGLSVAHGIVRGHGGRIELRSRVGAGSTFKVVLPIAGPPVTPASSPPPIPLAGGRYGT